MCFCVFLDYLQLPQIQNSGRKKLGLRKTFSEFALFILLLARHSRSNKRLVHIDVFINLGYETKRYLDD